ncbi:MAG: DUF423 domain-containing protein [Nitrospirae bacterium]|nr:MAG: DUF423 domain-containing protein [Nitrospirota bacterium]
MGAGFGFLAVAAGAFGAHSLKSVVSQDMLELFKTAVHYQMVHALALLANGLLLRDCSNKLFHYAVWSFVAGILLFCGSLYLLVLTDAPWAGMVTPVGGLLFLGGWLCVVLGCLHRSKEVPF